MGLFFERLTRVLEGSIGNVYPPVTVAPSVEYLGTKSVSLSLRNGPSSYFAHRWHYHHLRIGKDSSGFSKTPEGLFRVHRGLEGFQCS